MRYLVISILLLFYPFTRVYAQTPVPQSVPAHLEPIERAPGSSILGAVFLYKGRRLNSPFSIEVPIQELNDPVANQHFRRFRTWTTVGRLTGLASIAYVLLNRTPDRQTSRTIYIGSLVASVGFSLLSNHQINSAVRRYNAVVGSPRLGFSQIPTFDKKLISGVSLTIPVSSSPD